MGRDSKKEHDWDNVSHKTRRSIPSFPVAVPFHRSVCTRIEATARRRCTETALLLSQIADGDTLWLIRELGVRTHKASEVDPIVVGRLVGLDLVTIDDGADGVVAFTAQGRRLWIAIRGLVD